MILSSTGPAGVAKSSHRPACFVPEAAVQKAVSSSRLECRAMDHHQALTLGAAGAAPGEGVRACMCTRTWRCTRLWGAGGHGGCRCNRQGKRVSPRSNPAFGAESTFFTKSDMFCLNYSASWYENPSKIPPHLFLKYLQFEDGLQKDFLFAVGAIADHFCFEVNPLPFLQGRGEVSGEKSCHDGGRSFFISNRIISHIS